MRLILHPPFPFPSHTHPLFPSHSISFPFPFPFPFLSARLHNPFPTIICMGGGPRTFPGGVTKWQWKRMQEKKAKQLLSARLAREKQIYEMRKRAELEAAVSELEKPWEVVEKAQTLFAVSADEQLKVLADRFLKPGGVDLWSENDGPQLFDTKEDGAERRMDRGWSVGREMRRRLSGKLDDGGRQRYGGSLDWSYQSNSSDEDVEYSRNGGRMIGNWSASDERIRERRAHMGSYDDLLGEGGVEDVGSGSFGGIEPRNSNAGRSRNQSSGRKGGRGIGNGSFGKNLYQMNSMKVYEDRDADLVWSSFLDRRSSEEEANDDSSGSFDRILSRSRSRGTSSNVSSEARGGNGARQNFQPRTSINFYNGKDTASRWSRSFKHGASNEDDSSRSFSRFGSRTPTNGSSRNASFKGNDHGGIRNGSSRQKSNPRNYVKVCGNHTDLKWSSSIKPRGSFDAEHDNSRSSDGIGYRSTSRRRSRNLNFEGTNDGGKRIDTSRQNF